MQLDAGVVAVGVFDDTEQTFMRALANSDGFADELVAAHGSGWWHGTSICTRLYHGRVHLRQVWSRSLNTTTLGSHRCDVGAADNENAIVLCLFSILDKKEVPVDVENTALARLSSVLFDSIIVVDFGTVPICSHGVFALLELVGDL